MGVCDVSNICAGEWRWRVEGRVEGRFCHPEEQSDEGSALSSIKYRSLALLGMTNGLYSTLHRLRC